MSPIETTTGFLVFAYSRSPMISCAAAGVPPGCSPGARSLLPWDHQRPHAVRSRRLRCRSWSHLTRPRSPSSPSIRTTVTPWLSSCWNRYEANGEPGYDDQAQHDEEKPLRCPPTGPVRCSSRGRGVPGSIHVSCLMVEDIELGDEIAAAQVILFQVQPDHLIFGIDVHAADE